MKKELSVSLLVTGCLLHFAFAAPNPPPEGRRDLATEKQDMLRRIDEPLPVPSRSAPVYKLQPARGPASLSAKGKTTARAGATW